MIAAVEISMYPLGGGDYRAAIQSFIDRLNTHADIKVLTNSLSTQIWGALERIMTLLALEMGRAATGGPQLVFVMKILPGIQAPH